jgi:hypothetical protein
MAVLASEATGGSTWAVRVASVLALAAAGCGGGHGVGLVCQTSVAGYCVEVGNCPRTWTEAQDTLLVCQQGFNKSVPICGEYRELIAMGIDSGMRYYYDLRTGALVAVVSYGYPGGESCVAGPGAFLVPSCDGSPASLLNCPTN